MNEHERCRLPSREAKIGKSFTSRLEPSRPFLPRGCLIYQIGRIGNLRRPEDFTTVHREANLVFEGLEGMACKLIG